MAILLVDDSRDDLLLVESYLKSAKYKVVTTDSADGALRYLKAITEGLPVEPIELILLDVKMPEFDGLDACRRIKAIAHFESVPILMVSVDTTPGTIQLAFRRGAVDYIRKPVVKAELLAKVAMILRIQDHAARLTPAEQKTTQNATVEAPASIDSLTGVMNWGSFDKLFEREWEGAARERRPLSLVCFSVENFKAFNDTYGYLTGDECLERIAQAAHATFSDPGQVVARYRGAEFVVLLRGTGAEEALSMADHLDAIIEALDLGPTVVVRAATAHPCEGASRADLLVSARKAVPNRK